QPGTHSLARWDGTTWSSLGSGLQNGFVYCLEPLPGGSFLAGGSFTSIGGVPANYIAQWDGTTWSGFGSGPGDTVISASLLPNGDLVAGTSLAFNDAMMRWDGASWSTFGQIPGSGVTMFEMTPRWGMIAGGEFVNAGGRIAVAFARLETDCPAESTSTGSGCTAPATPLVLSTQSLPWTGTTVQSTTTGFVPGALGVNVLGFSRPNQLLSALHPAGSPGCLLLASLESQALVLPVGGVATGQFSLPNTAVLVGLPLYQQTLQLEITPTLSLSSSNGLRLVIGTF
ncbi:MAG: hypothetical protein KDC98_25180, partial [Planctomycetes bacterium]|nr:hypothetical protein [Planctomycetota bacterium]